MCGWGGEGRAYQESYALELHCQPEQTLHHHLDRQSVAQCWRSIVEVEFAFLLIVSVFGKVVLVFEIVVFVLGSAVVLLLQAFPEFFLVVILI